MNKCPAICSCIDSFVKVQYMPPEFFHSVKKSLQILLQYLCHHKETIPYPCIPQKQLISSYSPTPGVLFLGKAGLLRGMECLR